MVIDENKKQLTSTDFEFKKDKINQEFLNVKNKNFWQDGWSQLRKNKLAVIGMIGLIMIILFALFAPAVSQHNSTEQNVTDRNLPSKIPLLEKVDYLPFNGKDVNGKDTYKEVGSKDYYLFGTDQLGRDLWSRTWEGARISLFIGVVAAILDIFIGVLFGAISGFYGGKLDTIMQRIIEIIASIPNLIIVILFVLIFEPSIWTIILAMSVTGWISMSRVVRGEFLKIKNLEFVQASKTLGAIIVTSMFTVPSAIFFEAFLSFIGIGVPAPQTSLGSLVNDGKSMLLIYPHELFIPATILSLLILFFYLFSDGLRDAFDPKMRK